MIKKNFTVAKILGQFHNRNDDGLRSELSLPRHQKQRNQETRAGKRGSLDFSGPRRNSLSRDVYADFLSLHQNRVLACQWSLGLLQTSWSWSEKLTHQVCPQCLPILHFGERDSHCQHSQMLEPPTYASNIRAYARGTPPLLKGAQVAVSVACPLGKGGRAWKQGKAFSAEAEGKHSGGNRQNHGSRALQLLSCVTWAGNLASRFPHLVGRENHTF